MPLLPKLLTTPLSILKPHTALLAFKYFSNLILEVSDRRAEPC